MEKPYNSKCDVYSFGILFWQMYAAKTPFELYGMKSLKSRVWEGEQKRPFVQEAWPVPIKSLMRRAWAADPKERPSFMQIYKILRNECVRVRNGDDSGLEHSRRRSTFVFRGSRGKLASTKSTEAPVPTAVAAA
jgi:serine/threonine protein kinase